jgi:hypothetical protein
MELSAAVVATRLDTMMRQELDIPATESESVFWTDSTCVLSHIRNESRRFQTFVANRISKIRDVSEPTQWKYINTKLNPADDASRGLTADEITQNERWLKGPEFLWQPNEAWQNQPEPGLKNLDNDPELKSENPILAATIEENRIDRREQNQSHRSTLREIFDVERIEESHRMGNSLQESTPSSGSEKKER